jgi:hypothetical protein
MAHHYNAESPAPLQPPALLGLGRNVTRRLAIASASATVTVAVTCGARSGDGQVRSECASVARFKHEGTLDSESESEVLAAQAASGLFLSWRHVPVPVPVPGPGLDFGGRVAWYLT